ncbi:MAG: hypothetical protein AVDCRST_MAG64-3421, partial [uncultured Phycisphaerae bacterium]
GAARRHRPRPAAVPRGAQRAARGRRQRLPVRPEGPGGVRRVRPHAAADGRAVRLAVAAGVLLVPAPQRPGRPAHPRPGRHRPPGPGLLRGVQQGRGDVRQARHRPGRARRGRRAGVRHDEHRLQPGAVRRLAADAELPPHPADDRPRGGRPRDRAGRPQGRSAGEADQRARLVAPRVLAGAVVRRPAERRVRRRPGRPVQPAPPAPAQGRREGQAARAADRAGPRRAAAARAGAVGDGADRDGRAVPRAGGEGGAAVGPPPADADPPAAPVRRPRRGPPARQRAAELLGAPGRRRHAHARADRVHGRQLVAGRQFRPAAAPQHAGEQVGRRGREAPAKGLVRQRQRDRGRDEADRPGPDRGAAGRLPAGPAHVRPGRRRLPPAAADRRPAGPESAGVPQRAGADRPRPARPPRGGADRLRKSHRDGRAGADRQGDGRRGPAGVPPADGAGRRGAGEPGRVYVYAVPHAGAEAGPVPAPDRPAAVLRRPGVQAAGRPRRPRGGAGRDPHVQPAGRPRDGGCRPVVARAAEGEDPPRRGRSGDAAADAPVQHTGGGAGGVLRTGRPAGRQGLPRRDGRDV